MDTEQQPGRLSLRELFVVMAIVGSLILIAPLFISDGVRKARMNPCRANIRNMSLAMAQYDAARSQYPGYNNNLAPTVTGKPDNDRSWTFVLLPFMDQQGLFDELKLKQVPNLYDSRAIQVTGGIDIDLQVLMCPSVPPEQRSPAATNYVVNSGQLDAVATASRPADFSENGVFHTGIRASPDDKLIVMSSRYVEANDGLSTTLLMAENADARAWSDTAERWTGFTWHHADGQPGPPVVNPVQSLGLNVMVGESRAGSRQSGAIGFARPSSYHPGGFTVVFCDSHARFISDQISYRVYQALMTPMGAGARDNSDPAGTTLPAGHAATVMVDDAEIK